MYNLQGIIRKGINNATTQFDKLGYVANNFANYNTTGYKAVRFEQMMQVDGYISGAERTDYEQGQLKITGNPFDIALKGPGFIPVVSPEGEVAYTRDGSFKRGQDGYLMTNDNWMVGNGIKIPSTSYKFQIHPNGNVVSYDKVTDTKGTLLGKISVVQFDNPEGLKPTGKNKVLATEQSGDAKLIKDHNYIAQHNLESSNTGIISSVNEMLRLNASMLASMRVMKVADDMYNKSINIRES